jgi:PAS domain S-box-containing protein
MAEFPWAIEPSYEGLLSLIEEMNCGILVRDLDGCVLYANKRLLEWSGYSAKELEGKPASILTVSVIFSGALA